jgi:universal stress protein A
MKTKVILKKEPERTESQAPSHVSRTAAHARPLATAFKLRRVLAPVDFSAASLQALDYAVGLAELSHAGLIVLHVVEPAVQSGAYLGAPAAPDETNQNLLESGREQLRGITVRLLAQHPQMETLVRMGHAHSEIADTAKAMGADLIVLATHGQTGAPHTQLGSTAERVVRLADCPVLTVRAAEPRP